MDIKDSYLHGTVGVVKSISVSADTLKYILADIAGTVREVTLPVATQTANGLLSKEDKKKLDNMIATKVANDLILKINSGTTEGTSLYTYNGSAAKTLDIKLGSNITLKAEANSLTINASNTKVTLTNTTDNASYRVLFSGNANDTTETTTARKSANLLFNPSIGKLTVGHLSTGGDIIFTGSNKDQYLYYYHNDAWAWRTGHQGTGTSDTNYFVIQNQVSGTVTTSLKIDYNAASKATFIGTVVAPTFQGNLDGTYVNKLTGYTKATSASSLAATDTLNAALGKLEYKAHYAYNWVIGVTATDTDEYINKWSEIVGFLDSVKEGTDILDEFVTRKTTQTITGQKNFNTDTNTKPLLISRGGLSVEAIAIGVNDSQAIFEYTNDEKANAYVFKMINTDSEGSDGSRANESYVMFSGSSSGSSVTANTFIGKLNNALTFSAGAFTAKTYNNSLGVTVNIPTHTSHLTNNSGFLTQHLSLANYVTLNTAQTITGTKTFSGGVTLSCGLNINSTHPITWNDGSYHQRIQTTDDSTTNTAVFTFQQSSNTGSSWTDLFTIKDNGHVIANKFITSGGTSSLFVKGDGSLDSNTYLTTTGANNNFVKYVKTTMAEINKTTYNPFIFNVENETLISGYGQYWYLLNFGSYSGGGYRTQLAMPYYQGIKDTDLFIRSASGYSWRTWRRVLHDNNYTSYTVKKDGTGATGIWNISISGNAGSASTSAKLSATTIISAKAFSLSNASWTDTGYTFASLASGTYAVQVTSGTNLVASGIMSVYKNLSDTAGDEIPLHVYGTAGWRPYLRTYANKLLISSNDASATSRTVTIKIALIL